MADPVPAWAHVTPGSRASFTLPVAVRADGSAVALPVLAVRGRRPGKTFLATAGVHGDEFEGIAALHALFADLDPERLAGTVVAVPVANPPAFEAGLRVNPDDRQDLARVFPGHPGGTVTEQLAHALTQRFIRHADLYCDLHSAGQYYAMPALVGYQLRPEPMLSLQRQAAKAFDLPIVWGTTCMPGRSLSAAGEHGVAGIYTEITGEGRCRPADVARYLHGLRRLLALLGIDGALADVAEPEWMVEDARPDAGFLQVQNRAPVGGLFTPDVGLWEAVQSGQQLGVIRDALGATRATVTAPHAGRVVFLRTFSRVLAGDPVCTILQLDRGPEE